MNIYISCQKICSVCYTSVHQPIFTICCLLFTNNISLTQALRQDTQWSSWNIDTFCPTISRFSYSSLHLLHCLSSIPFQPVFLTSVWAKSVQEHLVHQHNVNRPGIRMQTSQTLHSTSPVLLSTSRCFQASLELSKELSASARALSGGSESTCTYGGLFRMLRDLICRRATFWSSGDLQCRSVEDFESSWDLCAALQETWCRILTAGVLRVP